MWHISWTRFLVCSSDSFMNLEPRNLKRFGEFICSYVLNVKLFDEHARKQVHQICDNYVPQWWVEFDDELGWLFTKEFKAFCLICRKYPTLSQSFCYSHSVNFYVSSSTKFVSKQTTQLIVELNSSLRQKIDTLGSSPFRISIKQNRHIIGETLLVR